jgi:TRAP transporter TAXI family solute receptor
VLRLLTFLYLFVALLSVNLEAKNSLILGSATKGGGYYTLAKSIKQILEDNNFTYDIKVVATNGSTDNIRRLEKGTLDLAITQNDVAFFAENGIGSFQSAVNNLTTIFTFYDEPIFLVTNLPNINTIEQLINKKISVGLNKSGILESAKVILKSSGIWDKIYRSKISKEKSIDSLLSHKIDAMFLNNLPPNLKDKIAQKELFIVPISQNFIEKLKNTFPYFSSYRYENDLIEPVNTIAVKSILLTTEKLNKDIVYKIVDILYKNCDKLKFPNGSLDRENAFCSNPLENWHTGVDEYFNDNNLNPISISSSDNTIWYLIAVVILIFILLYFLFFYILYKYDLMFSFGRNSSLINLLKDIYLKAINHKYTLFIFIFSVIYLLCILLVKYYEHKWAIEHNVYSIFDNYTIYKSLLWLFIFSTSGYSDQFFPYSDQGKFIASLLPMIGLGGILTLVGLITSDHIKRYFMEVRGMSSKRIKDHIILCGWNENAPQIVENLLHENISHKRQIVILAEIPHEMPIEKFGFNPRYVSYIRGTATNRDDLKRANLAYADIAILISDEGSEDMDAKTILKILTVEKYGLELEESGERKNRANIHTVAEIMDPNNIQIALDAGVDQIISLGNIESKIFTQAVQNPGVAKFVNEIFTYNEYNDIYSIEVTKDSHLLNKTYDEILKILRKYNILLLSINIENRRNKKEVITLMNENNLKRSNITNPFIEEEVNYKTHSGDLLIVLAQYEKKVMEAIFQLKR